jgi:hypothetical protein
MKAAVVTLLAVGLLPLVALAQEGKVELNTITGVQVSGGTVQIVGSKKPNFTTFTMSDPPRLVIDISEAVFSGVQDEIAVSNGVITGIRTASYGSDESAIARVLIGFERDWETDLQASGNSLVVKVMTGGAAPVAQGAPAQGEGTAGEGTAVVTQADRAQQERAAADANAAAQADRAQQERAAADANAAAQADRQRQEREAAAAAKAKADEDARQAQARADADRKAQEEAARVAAAQAEKDRREQERLAAASAAEDQKRRQAEERTAAEELKRQQAADARAAAEERKRQQEEARERQQAEARAAAEERKRQQEEARARREEEAQAAADAKRVAREDSKARAAEERAQREQEARAAAEARQQTRLAQAGPTQGPVSVSSRRKTLMLVGFRQEPEGSSVFIRTNEPVRYNVLREGDTMLVLELENTRIGESRNTLPLDTSFFNTAVAQVDPSAGPSNSVRVAIRLKQAVTYEMRQQGNELFIEFPRPTRR